MKGSQKSGSHDQTLRSKYSIQAIWEFQHPSDSLPWLSLRNKCENKLLQ